MWICKTCRCRFFGTFRTPWICFCFCLTFAVLAFLGVLGNSGVVSLVFLKMWPVTCASCRSWLSSSCRRRRVSSSSRRLATSACRSSLSIGRETITWPLFPALKGALVWELRSLGFSWFLHHKASMGRRQKILKSFRFGDDFEVCSATILSYHTADHAQKNFLVVFFYFENLHIEIFIRGNPTLLTFPIFVQNRKEWKSSS